MKPVIAVPFLMALCIGVWESLLGVGAPAWAGPGGFEFSVPPGWLDVSPGAPDVERQKAPPAIRASVDSGNYAFFAVDLEHGNDGFLENVNAIVRTGGRPPLATAPMLDEMAKGIQAEVVKQGMSFHALKMDVVKVAGVTAGRIVGEMRMPGSVAKIIQYSIPGHLSHASLTFSTTPENFGQYEPIFDQAAQATRGAVEPAGRWDSIWDGWYSNAIMGGVAGGLAALMWFTLKRKKNAGSS